MTDSIGPILAVVARLATGRSAQFRPSSESTCGCRLTLIQPGQRLAIRVHSLDRSSGWDSPGNCELLVDESEVMVRDLRSRHGTYVDGERVTGQRLLVNGNVLALGPIAYKVLISDCIGDRMLDRFRRALPSRLPRLRQPVEP